jgi:hypothetical protein
MFTPQSAGHPLATPLSLNELQKLTYSLSFQYGTANKAPRLPSILQYSSRLNKLAIGYIHRRCDGNDDGGRLFMGDDDAYCDSTGDGRILRQGRILRNDPGMDRCDIPMLPFHPHFSA